MPVVIREIVTEVVLSPEAKPAAGAPGDGQVSEDAVDAIVRRCTERVVEVLRREWDL